MTLAPPNEDEDKAVPELDEDELEEGGIFFPEEQEDQEHE